MKNILKEKINKEIEQTEEESSIKPKKKFKDMNKLEKAWAIISTGFVVVFGLVAVVFLISSVSIKAGGGEAMGIGGTEVRLVLTESMMWGEATPESHKKDLETGKAYPIANVDKNVAVFISRAPSDETNLKTFHDSLKVGDVATIYYVESGQKITVTHRIITKEVYGNGYHFILQGDNFEKGTPGVQHVYTATDKSNPYPIHTFVGKVTKVSPALGGFMVVSRSKVAIITLILVPCGVVIIYELAKIIIIVKKDKKDKLVAQIKAQMNPNQIPTPAPAPVVTPTPVEEVKKEEPLSTEDEITRLKRMLEEKEKELQAQKAKEENK